MERATFERSGARPFPSMPGKYRGFCSARRCAALGCSLLCVIACAVPTVLAQEAASEPTPSAPAEQSPAENGTAEASTATPPVAAPAAASVPTTDVHPASKRELVWNPAWPRFRSIGYVFTGVAVAGSLAATFLVPYPKSPRWTGGILFDDAIRDAVRARDPGVRDGIRVASDITLITSIVQVALVDSIIIPLAEHNSDVAWQLSLMNAQAFALDTLLSTLLYKVAARARPSYAQCNANPNFDPLCKTGEYASFPSSHASVAFTAAGLSCVHHAHLPIYGGGAWDTAACVESLVLASATAAFRVVGDRHYTTDVLFGSMIGFALGFVYPYLFHYGDTSGTAQASSSRSALHWGVVPGAGNGPYGASLTGIF
jgi:membrane-associated phospholipid phosphatase